MNILIVELMYADPSYIIIDGVIMRSTCT